MPSLRLLATLSELRRQCACACQRAQEAEAARAVATIYYQSIIRSLVETIARLSAEVEALRGRQPQG